MTKLYTKVATKVATNGRKEVNDFAMMDFVKIKTSTKTSGPKGAKEETITIFPEFLVGPSEDLMVRGKAFYAVWDESNAIWRRDEGYIRQQVDQMLFEKRDEFPDDVNIEIRTLKDFSTKKWTEFLAYCAAMPDNYHELDSRLVFSDEHTEKSDYSSRKLPYPLKMGDTPAYDELMETLYEPIERQKIEWAIGAVVAGDSKKIQKFLVLYGSAGTGKSTVLNIIDQLFVGYSNTFESAALGSVGNQFALETFKNNPLVSIEHDGDLSKIETNTRLNSIVSHERIIVNEKHKAPYESRFNTFLFIGTNKPVKITDAKSGIVRRLIDVQPSGKTIPFNRYSVLMSQIGFELGAIAYKCLKVYSSLGIDAYDSYRPTEMMGATNDFYNFVEDHYDIFKQENGTSLAQAWALYKRWADESAVRYPLSRRDVKEELKNYFSEFRERRRDASGNFIRNAYVGFNLDKFSYSTERELLTPGSTDIVMSMDSRTSILDKELAEMPAQLANESGTPMLKWADVKTILSDLDTNELHYVKVPENHIVIDFDLKDESGEKNLERNLKAASKWPSTYGELSKSGYGVHLHYIYEGDVNELSNEYDEGIEVKVFEGGSALRRKLTRCNDIPIATLSSGLPLKKGGKDVINFDGIKNEKAIRTLIKKNLKKDIHPGTKPSIDFIYKILEDAYSSGMHYDVTDMRQAVMAFANNSTHQSQYCVKLVNEMHFHSDNTAPVEEWVEKEIVFYDVEVFPNLFVVVWKREGSDSPVRLINPTPSEIETLTRMKLVGFNNRRYDNHILYARLLGFTNEQLYNMSQKIISGSRNAMFREAYNLSYTDIYDFSSKKQSLKKFEIDLGIHHQELSLPWDEPVPENKWETVASYCENDVLATEAVFKARYDDFLAREILASLSGLTVNDTTRQHMTKIIFEGDRSPQSKFVYTDLSEMFPGYSFDAGKSSYKGEDPGEGGYVYAEPGIYENVALLDVASMHPNSLIQLNLFGPYTKNFEDLVNARIFIKHGELDKARGMLGGKLAPYIQSENPDELDNLSYALKIAINSVYGYTKAGFDCEFKDPRNVDNIVAKRGALFMVDLKGAVQEEGYSVAHIKTDSIKIPKATKKIIKFVTDFGKKYGYTFEHEATYSKLCLVNQAVYIARDLDGVWHATGAQFAVPYVFKTLFSHEGIVFEDLCEAKSVTKGAMYLDMNEDLPEGEHNYIFVGRTGLFCPVKSGCGGGTLLRKQDDKFYAVAGTKGFRWLEAEVVENLGKQSDIDLSYYDKLVDEAIKTISEYGDFEDFVKE